MKLLISYPKISLPKLLVVLVATQLWAGKSSADSASSPQNLVNNPGFEVGTNHQPSGWYRDLKKTGKKGRMELSNKQVHNGQKSLRLFPNKKNDASFPLSVAQEIPTQGLRGKKIHLSGYLSTEPGAVGLIGIMSSVKGSSGKFEMLSQIPNGNQWQFNSMSYLVPDDPSVKLYVSLIVSGTTGSVGFDDVRISRNGLPRTDTKVPAGSAGSDQVRISPSSVARIESPVSTECKDSGLKAAIKISADDLVREIPDSMFGANIEWPWNATGLWNEGQQRVDPKGKGLTKALGVKLIRFPGGIDSDFYHWRDGIGAFSKRPEVKYRAGNVGKTRPNFGTDEALAFAEDLGGELLITVNAGTGTAEEAADWVRYVNKDQLRVRYWEVGNELYISSAEPHTKSITINGESYADRFLEFAKAMKNADPRIKVGAIGGLNEGIYQQMSYPDWNVALFEKAADYIDFLAVHNAYAPILTGDEKDQTVGDVYKAMFARPVSIANNLRRQTAQIEKYFGDDRARPFIAVTEWGPIFQFFHEGKFVDHPKTLGSAIYSASTFKVLLESPLTQISAFWMLNDFSALGWMGSLNDHFPPAPEWAETARYYSYQMFSKHFGSWVVETSVESPTFDNVRVGWSDSHRKVPYLEVITSLSKSGDSLHVLVINKHFDEPIYSNLAIDGFTPSGKGVQWQLTGQGVDAHTGTKVIKVPWITWGEQEGFENNPRFHRGGQEEIVMNSKKISGIESNFSRCFPPMSVTTLILDK
ncbi:MAG: hypothetical protein JKY89_04920 [Immundisolibacteraceae bacterium]|nr:hypothetical protein [Immundisolibacteraceae bacterium]